MEKADYISLTTDIWTGREASGTVKRQAEAGPSGVRDRQLGEAAREARGTVRRAEPCGELEPREESGTVKRQAESEPSGTASGERRAGP